MATLLGATNGQSPPASTLFENEAPVELAVPEYFSRKELWIRLLGAFLLVLFSPLILLCMFLVKLTSNGPALLRQTRLGKDDKPFEILKIRSMYNDAEHIAGPVLCQKSDPRITPLGKVLRFLHLDELPQLINVARGEMCLVGPRPERPEIITKHQLLDKVPGFAERTKVLPGVTGLAQINLPADLTAECVKPKVKLDLNYIVTANANLDSRILLCTALRMLGVRHGHAVKMLGLDRNLDCVSTTSKQTHIHSKHTQTELSHPNDKKQLTPAIVLASDGGDKMSSSHSTTSWVEETNHHFPVENKPRKDINSLPHKPR